MRNLVILIPKNVDDLEKPVCQSVKDFLKENKGKAYPLGEIKEELGMGEEKGDILERNIGNWIDGESIDCSTAGGKKYYLAPSRF